MWYHNTGPKSDAWHNPSVSSSQAIYGTYMHAKSLQLCLTQCDSMDCSLPGFSVYGILQARIMEWVAMPSSRGSSWPRNRTHISYVSCISRWGSLPLAPPGKPQGHLLQPNSKKVQSHSVSQESQSLPRGFDEALTPAPLSLLWTSEAKPISPPVNSQPSISTIHPWPFVDSAFYTSAEKPGFWCPE